jgi:hypothetical protein
VSAGVLDHLLFSHSQTRLTCPRYRQTLRQSSQLALWLGLILAVTTLETLARNRDHWSRMILVR